MVLYRRSYVPGGTYFFTVALADRRRGCLIAEIDLLRLAFHQTMRVKPFQINAAVILPDHLHMIWTLPARDDDYSGRWKSIKSKFTMTLRSRGVPIHKNARGEYNLWQKRFGEHTIWSEADLLSHTEYIHHNPVKHGYVERPDQWAYSSFRRSVAKDIYSSGG